MNRPSHRTIRRTLAVLALTLTLAVAFLLVCSPVTNSRAQQERQLTQTGSPKTNPDRRIALVIGNGAYTNAPPLKNPTNDARDMATTLKSLGFDVTSGINTNQREMKRLIREFGQKLKTGGSGLFYYAGHGVQSKGRNYLIPVDADIQSEVEAEDAGVEVSLVLGYMDDAQNGLNIVILDACRNNPFARSFRSASSGLAQVDAPTGTLIAYATAPGRVASDGPGQNGLYTSELLKQMRVPGLSATEMFMRVRAEVIKQTTNKQVPWEASSLVGTFYFSKLRNAETPAGAPAKTATADPSAFELSFWETIKNSKDPDDFRSYLQKYPSGQFAELARRRAASGRTTTESSTPNEIKSPDNGISKDAASLYDQGLEAMQKGDIDSAILLLNRAIVADPGLAAAWMQLTSAYLRRAASAVDTAKADADYLNAVRAGEGLIKVRTDAVALTRFGQTLIAAQQYARAATALERAAESGDATGLTFLLLGMAQSRSKEFPKAIAALERASQLRPEDANVYRELGYAYEASKQYARALAVYQKGLNLFGDLDFRKSVDRVRPFAN